MYHTLARLTLEASRCTDAFLLDVLTSPAARDKAAKAVQVPYY